MTKDIDAYPEPVAWLVERERDGTFPRLHHRRVERFGFLWLRKRAVSTHGIYVEVGGVGPWQELLCAKGKERVEAFLFGLINGCMDTNRKAQQQGGGYAN